MNKFGKNIIISLSGASHKESLKLTIQGINKGLTLNEDLIKNNLRLRLGNPLISTSRKEKDEYEILSGYVNHQTTGEDLVLEIKNIDILSTFDGTIRPGHADYTQYMKYLDADAIQGGGIASGRMTALLVIAGSICEDLLLKEKIVVKSYIRQIGKIKDKTKFQDTHFNQKNDYLNLLNPKLTQKFINYILKIKKQQDSIGGIIETYVKNPIIGIGEPFFDSFESYLSHLIFSIPGVNGIKFGDAFNPKTMKGSVYNDIPYIENNQIKFKSNHCGGIQGGLTNGNIIRFTTSVRPTSSIGKIQESINLYTFRNTQIRSSSRHDPSIVPKVLHVINAVTNIALYDLLIERKKYEK